MNLTIVIPCFNEERNLPTLFFELDSYMIKNPNVDVLFVNDGSTDSTEKLINIFTSSHARSKQISYSENKGKGYAVKTGVIASTGDYRLLFDADLAVPLSDISKINAGILAGHEVIIGSRTIEGSKIMVNQGVLRIIFGKIFTILARIFTGVKVSDFTCGFKCFSKKVVETIFNDLKIDRWAYDAEILFLAQKNNFKIHEVPVVWRNGSESRVKILRDGIRSFLDLIKIKKLHRNG